MSSVPIYSLPLSSPSDATIALSLSCIALRPIFNINHFPFPRAFLFPFHDFLIIIQYYIYSTPFPHILYFPFYSVALITALAAVTVAFAPR